MAATLKYEDIIKELRVEHGKLLEIENFSAAARENPALISDTLMRMRLRCNLLFRFINDLTDKLNAELKNVAAERQLLYEEAISKGKSPSAAESHAREMTRSHEAGIKILENQVQQVRNEYERFNGICMALQSVMREYNTERVMG